MASITRDALRKLVEEALEGADLDTVTVNVRKRLHFSSLSLVGML
jgi:hypothetical protein